MVCLLKGQGLAETKEIRSFIVYILSTVTVYFIGFTSFSATSISRANTVSKINSNVLLLLLYIYIYAPRLVIEHNT